MAVDAKERYALIRRYANGSTLLRRAFARVPSAALKWRPAPGEWSAHEVICHCADSETNSYGRIRFLVAEPAPVIQGYDQDRWASSLDYQNHPVAPALGTVAAVRANTTALIRRLSEDAWARRVTHTESGPYSAEQWLRIYAEHLEIHARQIDANVAAWRKAHPMGVGRAARRTRASRRQGNRSARIRSA